MLNLSTIFMYKLFGFTLGLLRITSSPNSTTRRLPSYLLCTLLLYFLLIFHLSRCTLPDFPSVSSLDSLPFYLVVIEQQHQAGRFQSMCVTGDVNICDFCQNKRLTRSGNSVFVYPNTHVEDKTNTFLLYSFT